MLPSPVYCSHALPDNQSDLIFIDDRSILLIMEANITKPRSRGRPKKNAEGHNQTRQRLLRAGMETLTQAGYSSTGLDTILKREGIPKGSFYYYFDSKEAFGKAIIGHYNQFFKSKLNKHLQSHNNKPLAGFHAFVEDAIAGIEKYQFQRGCLIGNLGQEMNTLPSDFRDLLAEVFTQWSELLAQYLRQEQQLGHIPEDLDCQQHSELFWIGWEGAVLHTKLQQQSRPIYLFADYFVHTLRS